MAVAPRPAGMVEEGERLGVAAERLDGGGKVGMARRVVGQRHAGGGARKDEVGEPGPRGDTGYARLEAELLDIVEEPDAAGRRVRRRRVEVAADLLDAVIAVDEDEVRRRREMLGEDRRHVG